MPSSSTERETVERAVRQAVTAALRDQASAEKAIRAAAAAILGRPDDAEALVMLRDAEGRHGRRLAAGAVARKLAPGEPLRQETAAHWLRDLRRRSEAERTPKLAPADQ
jgi:hypothetical protein